MKMADWTHSGDLMMNESDGERILCFCLALLPQGFSLIILRIRHVSVS